MNSRQTPTTELELLYRDDQVVAINKPAGLLVHRSRIDVHARKFAVQLLRDQIKKSVYLVHRLDRPTSGILLFALTQYAARLLSQQFANGIVKKKYRAIVRGHTAENGYCSEPLQEKHDPISDSMARQDKLPQPATTEFSTVRKWEIPYSAGKYPNSRYSEVDIHPLTGRKHQIRRHFNHMAHPILGDSSHGDTRHNRLFRELLGVTRLLLVATRLQFQHPTTQESIEITAPVGKQYEKAVEQLNQLTSTTNE